MYFTCIHTHNKNNCHPPLAFFHQHPSPISFSLSLTTGNQLRDTTIVDIYGTRGVGGSPQSYPFPRQHPKKCALCSEILAPLREKLCEEIVGSSKVKINSSGSNETPQNNQDLIFAAHLLSDDGHTDRHFQSMKFTADLHGR